MESQSKLARLLAEYIRRAINTELNSKDTDELTLNKLNCMIVDWMLDNSIKFVSNQQTSSLA